MTLQGRRAGANAPCDDRSRGAVLHARDYEQIRTLAYSYCGIDLRGGKEELVKARLGKKLAQLGLQTYREYCDLVVRDRSGESLAGMIDALTTNHTNFFREPQHFAFLRALLVDNARRGLAPMRVWSAACATGEEPYSIAFTMADAAGSDALVSAGTGEFTDTRRAKGFTPTARWGTLPAGSVLATDISTQALAKASAGTYREERFQGIAVASMRRYLLRGEGKSRGLFKVRPEIRSMIEFRRLNLMEAPSGVGHFQVIFCRNVMIYFDQPTQEALIARLVEHLHPGGHLFIGHSESLNGMRHALEYVQPATYRKPADGTA
jgi:chemotaxis protein methyltransferase CheR